MNIEAKINTLLNDETLTTSYIAEKSGISRVTITNLRNEDHVDINRMMYANVMALSNMADDLAIYRMASHNAGLQNFIARFGVWMDEAYKDQLDAYRSDEMYIDDLAIGHVVQELGHLAITDKATLIMLYRTYVENLPDEE